MRLVMPANGEFNLFSLDAKILKRYILYLNYDEKKN